MASGPASPSPNPPACAYMLWMLFATLRALYNIHRNAACKPPRPPNPLTVKWMETCTLPTLHAKARCTRGVLRRHSKELASFEAAGGAGGVGPSPLDWASLLPSATRTALQGALTRTLAGARPGTSRGSLRPPRYLPPFPPGRHPEWRTFYKFCRCNRH